MRDLRAIAKRLGGEVVSGAISCSGPGHSRLDRSLRVFLYPDAPAGFRVTSMAGDDWRECRAHVERLLGLAPWQPGRPESQTIPPTVRKPVTVGRDRNAEMALRIWREAVPIAGTIAETYLVKRMSGAMSWPGEALRFHARCPRGDCKLPALVALLRDIASDEPRAVQRIFLWHDGSDRLRDAMGKATLGPAASAVCKLAADDTVTAGLGICEGIEKSVALMAIGWAPIWATCGATGMAKFPVLSGIETLTIFADADAAGRRAADECAQRWSDGRYVVKVRTPKRPGADWSDTLGSAA